MVIKCPNCLTQYRINTSRVSKSLIKVQCPSCKKSVLVNVKKLSIEDSHPSEGRAVGASAPRPTLAAKEVLSDTSIERIGDLLTITVDGKAEAPILLIADEPRAFRDFLRKTLEEMGCRVIVVDDGYGVEQALRQPRKPHLIFMNVVLKHTMGFILCEKIKSNPDYQTIKVVLIGAIFRIDRFRRDPSNLYGADDYIEEIIVKQDLQERVKKLLGVDIRQPLQRDFTSPNDVVDHARRLARIILSDIIIYNQGKVDESIQKDAFFTELGEELQEGKKYFREKIPSDRSEINEIFDQTISDYVKRRKRELTG